MAATDHDVVYKIVTSDQWSEAQAAGVFKGAAIDLRDGYIHLSTAEQVRETAARHFAGQDDLLLISIVPSALRDALVYEPARGGALFPHLYDDLPLSAVIASAPLPLGDDGRHRFPDDMD